MLPARITVRSLPAVNDTLPPIAMEESAATCVTTIPIEPLIVLSDALTVTEPAFAPVRTPAEFTIAMVVSEDFHATCGVMSSTVPSLNLPWAAS